jgi:hypothetical protein
MDEQPDYQRIQQLEAESEIPLEEVCRRAEIEAILQELEDNGHPFAAAHYRLIEQGNRRIGVATDPVSVLRHLSSLGDLGVASQ